ncbi:MAG TPA: NifB/NifX family molybdenum-iron cluster-binding protein [Dehalococcoidales bacterium]|nr:NifB/NifX family molybdenum-iron cluster-binding protein [Dehalococcoidales bacterium]
MKIAAVSEDGITISQHFGRASQYVVVDVEDGKITGKEIRQKVGHMQFAAAGHQQQQGCECGCGPHGYEPGAEEKHSAMSGNVLDASVVLAGGMGWGAYESLKARNLEPVITDVKNIEEAAKLYAQGKLPNLMERLH